jgi:hypothetical protein
MKPKNQGHQNKQSGLTLDPKDLQGRLRFTGHHDRRHHGAHRRGQHRDVGAWEACESLGPSGGDDAGAGITADPTSWGVSEDRYGIPCGPGATVAAELSQ